MPMAGDIGNTDSTPGLGSSPGGGNGNPLQYSDLEQKYHGQKSLVGLQSMRSQSQRTERLSRHIISYQIVISAMR